MDSDNNDDTDDNQTIDIHNIDQKNLMEFKEFLISASPEQITELLKKLHRLNLVNPDNISFSTPRNKK